jgi:TPR repeat protein
MGSRHTAWLLPAGLLAATVVLSACSGEGVVPPVDTPLAVKPVPGNYAATVVSGSWTLKTESDAYTCGAWVFDTDVNPSYEQAMRTTLTRALEHVTFTPEILSPAQLKAQGYDAQIVIGQGKASSTFAVAPYLFEGTARSDVDLAAILAIRNDGGEVSQRTVSARGHGAADISFCPKIGEAIGDGANDALRTIATQVALYVGNALGGRQRATAAAPAPSSADASPKVLGATMAPVLPPPSRPRTTAIAPSANTPRTTPPSEAARQAELKRDLAREAPDRGGGASGTGDRSGAAATAPPTQLPSSLTAKPPSAGAPGAVSPAAPPDAAPKNNDGATFAPGVPPGSFNANPPDSKSSEAASPDADTRAREAFMRGADAAAGRGVAKSDAEAAKWYRIAADQGYAPAENNLGFLYAEGRGVPHDDAEAVKWYRRAADRNYAPAETSLGMMYAQGRGVKQSDSDALSLYSAAASQGYPQAKANLARMYAEGRGVARDERTASFLLGSVRGVKPSAGSGVYVEPGAPPHATPGAAPGQ